MTKTFCTIITSDYFPYAMALYKSLTKYDPEVLLQVLVTDDKPISAHLSGSPGLKIVPVSTLENYSLVNSLYKKYAHTNMDFFRWSLKPVFMSYLLDNGFEKVLFTDCDIYFFNDYHFLFDELDESSVLLTPQWYNSNPLTDEQNFVTLMTKGAFNAGFVGANKNGVPALQWWAGACHFKMGALGSLGIHDDQRYLDIFPAKFEKVKIIRHKGCNLSAGNEEECERKLVGDKVLINGVYPIIFIHFTPMMANQIIKGYDPLLLPYLETYKQAFEDFSPPTGNYITAPEKYIKANAMVKLKWKLKLRTRIKKLLYNLAHKI